MMSNPDPAELGDRLVPLASGKLRLKLWKENAGYTESRQARFTRKKLDESPEFKAGTQKTLHRQRKVSLEAGSTVLEATCLGSLGGGSCPKRQLRNPDQTKFQHCV